MALAPVPAGARPWQFAEILNFYLAFSQQLEEI
jgi:hypothetical protein